MEKPCALLISSSSKRCASRCPRNFIISVDYESRGTKSAEDLPPRNPNLLSPGRRRGRDVPQPVRHGRDGLEPAGPPAPDRLRHGGREAGQRVPGAHLQQVRGAVRHQAPEPGAGRAPEEGLQDRRALGHRHLGAHGRRPHAGALHAHREPQPQVRLRQRHHRGAPGLGRGRQEAGVHAVLHPPPLRRRAARGGRRQKRRAPVPDVPVGQLLRVQGHRHRRAVAVGAHVPGKALRELPQLNVTIAVVGVDQPFQIIEGAELQPYIDAVEVSDVKEDEDGDAKMEE
ncbi:hypothetical protein ON010_g16883 [Phytophthora cinnamomi]|nr:hypothetical protein ON010_g16883 [Phytophthora cinnamomi]